MKLISSLSHFLTFLPKLAELHKKLDGKWEPSMNAEEFAEALLSRYTPENYYFGELTPEGEVAYFINAVQERPDYTTIWLLFVDTAYRDKSQQIVRSVLEFLSEQGVKEVRFTTTRMTSSYQRWVKKFDAKPYSLTYSIEL